MLVNKLILALAFLLTFPLTIFVYRLLPSKSGRFEIDNELGTAKVYFEDNGVPHIEASNRKIGAFTLGYIHASDRLWQIHSMRLIAQGRLSEVFGAMTYGLDETMRLFNLKQQCEIIVSNMDDESYYFLLSYTKGINFYVANNQLPLQFQLFWIDFEDWTPYDACSLIKFMHLGLNQNWGYEIIADYISAVSNDEDLAERLFSYHYDFFENHTIPIISDEELMDINLYRKADGIEKPSGFRVSNIKEYLQNVTDILHGFGTSGPGGGSNSWIISGNHTKSGKPLFVNDPHLKNSLATTWHLSHIEYPDGSFIAGGCIPGLPFYGVFSTDKMAGGVTSIFADNSDIYEERINGDEYLYNGSYQKLEIRKEIIKVRFEKDREFIVRSTHHGPLINKRSFMMNEIIPMFPILLPEGDFSLKWTGLNPYLENGFESTYYGMFANSTLEALDLLRKSKGLSQNIVLADKYNNIAFGPSGHYPIRIHPQLGNRISRGWIGENEWEGYYSHMDKPYLLNPKKGYIVAANNPLTTPNVKSKIAIYTVGRARANRINELVKDLISRKSGQIEYSDMIQILSDTKDVFAEDKKTHMLIAIDKYLNENKVDITEKQRSHLEDIRSWNSHFDKNLTAPVYYSAWEYCFYKNFLTKQIPNTELKMKFLSAYIVQSFFLNFYETLAEDINVYQDYCKGSCPQLLLDSLTEAIDFITKKTGKSRVAWSDVHVNHYKNNPFSRTPMAFFFNKKTPSAGNGNTINMADVDLYKVEENLFEGTFSANIKLIAEVGVALHYSLDTGNSENALSPHYFNMNDRHLNQDLYPLISIKDIKKLKQDIPDMEFIGKGNPEKQNYMNEDL